MKIKKRVRLQQNSHFSLKREKDGRGDSGAMLCSINPKTQKQIGSLGTIIVGCCVQCGSFFARSYANQDWWKTSPVIKILEVSKNNSWVKIETKTSIYEIRSF